MTEAIHLVADYINDYSPLLDLPAFQLVKAQIEEILPTLG
jgi:hypothetical protein